MAAVKKARLDELLVAKGLADTRSQAKALILAGKVKIGTHRLDKPGQSLNADSEVTVESPPRFVSRGGEKLEGFLDHFEITMEGTHVLDVGASTGGFTDCSLQRGAINATCVDVGRAQLHNKLIQNDRVGTVGNICRHFNSTINRPRRHDQDVVLGSLDTVSRHRIQQSVFTDGRKRTRILSFKLNT